MAGLCGRRVQRHNLYGEVRMIHQEEISIQTRDHGDMHDLTDEVVRIVRASGVADGLVNVFHLGSTGAIVTIEYEPGLQRDLPSILDRLMPPGRHYGHEQTWHDGNAHSHLQATTLGPDMTVPVRHGRPALGTWQQIVHLECDVRPRQRRIVVTVYG